MAGSRAQGKAATRERLLDAALDVFASQGFGGATVRQIATGAGCTTGALFAHFPSKEAVFLVLLEERYVEKVVALGQLLAGAPTPAKAVRALDDRFRGLVQQEGNWDLLATEFWLYAARHPEVAPRLAGAQRQLRDGVEELLRRHAPEMTPGRRRRLAVALLACGDGLGQLRRFDPGAVPGGLFGSCVAGLIAYFADH